jgi:hypothetical protein
MQRDGIVKSVGRPYPPSCRFMAGLRELRQGR